MTDQEYYFFKLIADSCGYIAGIITGFLFGKYFFKKEQISIPFRNSEQKFLYYLSMLAGAMWFEVQSFENIFIFSFLNQKIRGNWKIFTFHKKFF